MGRISIGIWNIELDPQSVETSDHKRHLEAFISSRDHCIRPEFQTDKGMGTGVWDHISLGSGTGTTGVETHLDVSLVQCYNLDYIIKWVWYQYHFYRVKIIYLNNLKCFHHFLIKFLFYLHFIKFRFYRIHFLMLELNLFIYLFAI